jgi:hypothetical protein
MFVILLMPKSTYSDEAEQGGKWFLYKVDHAAIDETPAVSQGLPFRNRSVLYADTPEEANLCAAKLAENNPGREVSVLEQIEIYAATTPPVVRKTVSKSGVLPA